MSTVILKKVKKLFKKIQDAEVEKLWYGNCESYEEAWGTVTFVGEIAS